MVASRCRCASRKGYGGGKGGYVRTKTRRGRTRTRRKGKFFGTSSSQYEEYKRKGWPRPPPRKPSIYRRRRVKAKGNPWALCNWLAKKHRWPKAKTERCIMKVKKKRGFAGRRRARTPRRIRRRR